jgi:hypothetical protein
MQNRNLINVIDQLLLEIPNDQNWIPLREQLIYNKNNAMYTAPEAMHEVWKQVGYSLNGFLPQTNLLPWQENIANIFANKGGEQLLID